MTNATKDAIAAARAKAAEMAGADDAEVVSQTLPATGGNPGMTVPTTKPSMATMVGTSGLGASVDVWLKVDEFGLSFADDKKKFERVKGHILMDEGTGFMPKMSIKWGDPVNYASTYDGVTSDKGTPWMPVVEQATRLDPRAKPYSSADILFILDEVLDLKNGTKLEKGTKVGITLSMSNWRDFEEFYKAVIAAGKNGQEVKTEIFGKEVTSKKGHTWGIVGFDLK